MPKTSSIPAKPERVLLDFRHGLGDAVQFGIVLRHLSQYRPQWIVDVKSLRGKHSALTAFCHASFHDGDVVFSADCYDRIVEVHWNEADRGFADVPSTKVSRCLIDEFGIAPDPELFDYRLPFGEAAGLLAARYLESICGGRELRDGRFPVMLLHYQGNTAQSQKDLTHEAALALCDGAMQAGLVPVILDWDGRSPLPNGTTIFCPQTGPGDIWGGFGSGDAETLAALIEQSALMVGIDSGPLHVAGGTTTPTYAVWTGHFPGQYFDHADNVTHYLPRQWQTIGLGADSSAAAYFACHYRFVEYDNLVAELLADLFAGHIPVRPGALIRCQGFWVRTDNVEQDLVIVRDIHQHDAYRTGKLPRQDGYEVVVDIGAHIGCFARLWHERNRQARIVCVEACPENLTALCANVGEFAEIIHAACTYEPAAVGLLNAVRPQCQSTGGSIVVPRSQLGDASSSDRAVYWPDVRPLQKVTLEELLARLELDHIDVLKLDCEGSEYSILGQTTSLERIHWIIGEYHGRTRWNEFRRVRFSDWHYRLLADCGESVGLFRLSNPVWPPATVLGDGHSSHLQQDVSP
ncbi:MAG: FkbM family methyltransferase [Pirellulaceae bacterium]